MIKMYTLAWLLLILSCISLFFICTSGVLGCLCTPRADYKYTPPFDYLQKPARAFGSSVFCPHIFLQVHILSIFMVSGVLLKDYLLTTTDTWIFMATGRPFYSFPFLFISLSALLILYICHWYIRFKLHIEES